MCRTPLTEGSRSLRVYFALFLFLFGSVCQFETRSAERTCACVFPLMSWWSERKNWLNALTSTSEWLIGAKKRGSRVIQRQKTGQEQSWKADSGTGGAFPFWQSSSEAEWLDSPSGCSVICRAAFESEERRFWHGVTGAIIKSVIWHHCTVNSEILDLLFSW